MSAHTVQVGRLQRTEMESRLTIYCRSEAEGGASDTGSQSIYTSEMAC